MLSKQELLNRAHKPEQDAMKLHPYYRGKIQVLPKVCIRNVDDFAIWYTPGVAEACRDIALNPGHVNMNTSKWNMVGVVSDGTRVLGLGNIGPEAGLPVMEGKALLYKYLGGVDSFPVVVNAHKAEEIIQLVKWISPSFGGINLEDIEQPKCFTVLDRLREDTEIPVWHDDQQGTATVTLAGLINALKVVGKELDKVKIAVIGSGAANVAFTRLAIAAGVDPKKMYVVDSKGILQPGRKDLEASKDVYVDKWRLCNITNAERRAGGIAEAMKGADVCIAASRSGPDVIKKEWAAAMAKDSILFACANPIPEIWPWECKEAGVRVIATGRSDFPNQVNNSMGFPGIFRGTLDVAGKTITDEMCIAAANELAACQEDAGLDDEHILPTMDEVEPFVREAVAVGMKAQEQGVARMKVSPEELRKQAHRMITESRKTVELLMKDGLIAPPIA